MLPPRRSLPLQGAHNFRDLGGYQGVDGRAVRWRKLFRSDHLGQLTDADVSALADLSIGRVFDFRGVQERQSAPCRLPGTVVHPLSIEPLVLRLLGDLLAQKSVVTVPQITALMRQTYRDFVIHNTPQFAALFAHLLRGEAPLVFHCTAGKDRTGFAAAMVLTALGVPSDVVMEDYLLSNGLFHPPIPATSGVLAPEVRAVLNGVQADFLEASFDLLNRDFGGVDAYLTQGLGLGPQQRERLADLYLAE